MRFLRLFLPSWDYRHFKIDAELIQAAALLYGFRVSELQAIRGLSNYVFYTPGKSYLKITPQKNNSFEHIQQINAWQKYLSNQIESVVQVLPSLSGKYAEKIPHKKGYYTSVLYETAGGRGIKPEEWDDEMFRRVGQLTGIIHRLTKDYQKKVNSFDIPEWHLQALHDFEYLPSINRKLIKRYRELYNCISRYEKNPENYGIIHGDIHKGNLILSGQHLKLIDFDQTCRSWFVNDIANIFCSTLLYWKKSFSESRERFIVFKTQFWKGYFMENHLSEQELKTIPVWMGLQSIYDYVYQRRMGEHFNFNPTIRAYFLMTKNLAETEYEKMQADLFY